MKKLTYQQLALKIINRIRDGEYSASGKLESIRELAQKYGVGRQVATSALKFLARKNYVYFVHGSGTYINTQQKPGLFHRIAFYYAEKNLTIAAASILYLRNLITKYNFELIPGSNFEEDFTFIEWFEKRKNFDAVIMSGEIKESDLNYLKRHKIPYVVSGNYFISAEHPQAEVDLINIARKNFEHILSEHKWHKVALLCGSREFRADSEITSAFIEAQKNLGLEYRPERILRSDSDGVVELDRYFAFEQPDAIVLISDFWRGFQKYCQLHPDFKRPQVVIPSSSAQQCPAELFDLVLDETYDHYEAIAEKIVAILFEQIERKCEK